MSLISNSGHDENNRYSGGKAGDQTGTEWYLRTWYNRPWNCVLRHPNANVRATIADLGVKAARNNKIGYDQSQRNTYWSQLRKVGYDPSKITVACEADCSAGVIANVRATGYLLNIEALKNINASYTGNMRSGFKNAGFQVLTDSKYLTSPDYLLPGDILLNDAYHTATNIEKGRYAGESIAYKPAMGGKIAVDGSWGVATTNKAQAVFGTVQDGIISGQPISNKRYLANAYTGSWQFVSGRAIGSNLIRAIQRRIGATADGYFGRKSVMKFQSWLGVSVDGSMGPATVKAFQNWLNRQ